MATIIIKAATVFYLHSQIISLLYNLQTSSRNNRSSISPLPSLIIEPLERQCTHSLRLMRIGRGRRDNRHVSLYRETLALLSRSQINAHYGNPYTSVVKDVSGAPRSILRHALMNQESHRKSDKWYHYRRLKSALHGYTVVVKDNINTQSLPTTCASDILREFQAPRDATVSQLLERAGLVLLAKTNMDEFGMGSHSRNSAFGPVTNGGSLRGNADADALSVGGSSGGSALAVAAKLAHIGIGTDTGGSVRLPAAYMGLCGFKPSYGRISRNGVIPYANSLDTVGIITRTADEARRTFDILDRPDNKDPTCLTRDSRKRIMNSKSERRVSATGSAVVYNTYDHESGKPEERLLGTKKERSRFYVHQKNSNRRRRIGVPLEYNIAEMHPLVRWSWVATLSYLQSQDCEIVPISLPSTKHALSAYYILAPAEASSNLAKYDGVRYGEKRSHDTDDGDGQLYARHRSENFGPEVKRRILLGTYSLSAGAMDNYFIQAQKIRRMVQKDFDSVFRMPNPLQSDAHVVENGVDLIICPTAPTPPPHIDYLESTTPIESYMNDVFTVPASLAGLPAISVRAPEHPDHPWTPEISIGMQAIGQYGDDYSVLYFAQNVLERFHHRQKARNVQLKKRMRV